MSATLCGSLKSRSHTGSNGECFGVQLFEWSARQERPILCLVRLKSTRVSRRYEWSTDPCNVH